MSKQRKNFINRFFEQIKYSNYLLLKFTEPSLDSIDNHSDLDILLPGKDWNTIEAIALQDATVEKVNRHLQQSMCQFFIHFKDGGYLQIDCLFRLVRKQWIYLNNEYLLENKIERNGVKTYSHFCLLEHLVLFNQLNQAGVPQKYIRYFKSLTTQEQSQLIACFNNKYNTNFSTLEELDTFDDSLRMKLLKYLKTLPCNQWVSRQKNYFYCVLDYAINVQRQRGFLISFSGVDGAGKSTTLEATRRLLQEKFRKKTVVIRHRPSLLPILSAYKYGKKEAENRVVNRLPRQGKNTSKIKSLFRFAYYYADYLAGRGYIFFKYQLRNYIVLYDRYYFDFIVDGKRTNLNLDQQLPTFLYRFVQKPALNFFLYAPADIILSRKKELSEEAITSMTHNYKNLFSNLSDRYPQQYRSIKNIHLSDTLQEIVSQIKEKI